MKNKVKKMLASMLLAIFMITNFGQVLVYAANNVQVFNVTKEELDNQNEEGYSTVTKVGNAVYKDYKQGTYSWKSGNVVSKYSKEKLPGCSNTFSTVGSAPTATAVVLSAYSNRNNKIPTQR